MVKYSVKVVWLWPNDIAYFARFTDLTGTDYSEGAIELARNLATRDGFDSIKFLVSIHAQIELFLSCQIMIFFPWNCILCCYGYRLGLTVMRAYNYKEMSQYLISCPAMTTVESISRIATCYMLIEHYLVLVLWYLTCICQMIHKIFSSHYTLLIRIATILIISLKWTCTWGW